jgi:hypothetical protein
MESGINQRSVFGRAAFGQRRFVLRGHVPLFKK